MSDGIQIIHPARGLVRLASETIVALRCHHLSSEERAEILKTLKWYNTPAYLMEPDLANPRNLKQYMPGTVIVNKPPREPE